MTLLLQIEQPGRLPLFVRRLYRDGAISVTFDRRQARRFAGRNDRHLAQASQVAQKWPEPGRVEFIPADL